MHTISNYVFDSDRLIIYKSDMDTKIVDIINETFASAPDYESVFVL